MKKLLIVIISLVILVTGIILINKDDNEKVEPETSAKLNPISKENAIKILKAEYGDGVFVRDEDIKIVGNEFIMEVYTNLPHDEDSETVEEGHSDEENLGEHKINRITGELIKE